MIYSDWKNRTIVKGSEVFMEDLIRPSQIYIQQPYRGPSKTNAAIIVYCLNNSFYNDQRNIEIDVVLLAVVTTEHVFYVGFILNFM